jgi:hypothetical protein
LQPFPRSITHEKRLTEPEKHLRYFFDVMRPSRRKLLALLPPSDDVCSSISPLELLPSVVYLDFRQIISDFPQKITKVG